MVHTPPLLPRQLRREKVQLEQTLEQEQEQQISKLTKKIERLEKDVLAKQSTLEKVWQYRVSAAGWSLMS